MTAPLEDPWLVGIWPGMGSVALTAGHFLQQQLGAKFLRDLPPEKYFDVEKVEIKDGVARVGWLPQCKLYGWKNPGKGKDLLIFIGEAQPSQRGFDFCRDLIAVAQEYGVRRVFTFAAMANPVHPRTPPKVFAVVNEEHLLSEIRRQDVHLLGEGQISGLNGVLLAAAAEKGLEAVCLLGEMPFFAVSVPNPKASLAVLRIFCALAGLDMSFGALEEQCDQVEERLSELLERMNMTIGETGVEPPEGSGFSIPAFAQAEESPPERSERPVLTPDQQKQVEDLFRVAEEDRAKAVELKRLLDRLGVFKLFEDRFLDLFKKGG